MKNSPTRGFSCSVIALMLMGVMTTAILVWQQPGSAQHRVKQRGSTKLNTTEMGYSAERAITGVCQTRRTDPKSTIPIDDMARTAPVPLSDPRVVAAQAHVQSLLTIAQRLVPFAVRRISMNNGV